MYKEFRFLPTIQFSLMIKRLKEVIRNKKKALFYIGGSDVLPPPLARDEETRLLKEYAGGSQAVSYTHLDVYKRQSLNYAPCGN